MICIPGPNSLKIFDMWISGSSGSGSGLGWGSSSGSGFGSSLGFLGLLGLRGLCGFGLGASVDLSTGPKWNPGLARAYLIILVRCGP